MTRRYWPVVAAAGLALALTHNAAAQIKTYPDGHGGNVSFPLGDASFADAVVRHDTGSKAPRKDARDPASALGVPDFDSGRESGYVSLGCGGELVVKFTDNALVDVAGPDLHVFEVGPDIEPTALAISDDGESWLRVGRIEGGQAAVDIGPYVAPGASFRYARLVDLKRGCSSETPGADIDAIGAIGSAQRIALAGAVLFDSGKYQLKPAATAAIDAALAKVDHASVAAITVAGYTDAVGDEAANQLLSERRAQAVAAWLTDGAGFAAARIEVEGHGEAQPVASNDTAAGRAQNRRVEITLRGERDNATATSAQPRVILGLWETGEPGTLQLTQIGDEVQGRYRLDNGRVRGRFTSDTVFEGYWIEDDSRVACKTSKDGSAHWGALRIEFAAASRDQFDAKWRYCGETKWRGRWSRGKRIL